MNPTKFKQSIDAETLDLEKLGWSVFRDDEHIIRYVKDFFKENYDCVIGEETALAFIFALDDLLSDIKRGKITP
jgi:hypothetical protein